jgi:hypothetical protein
MSRRELDPKFEVVVQAFSGERRVAYGGKGFGATALRLDGKIFAMLSPSGRFVVKLPKERVDELVRRGQGQYFDPGHGKLLKEWLAVDHQSIPWLELAKEAYEFASRGKGR